MVGLVPGGRLTLTTATPVPLTDVTAATTIYYTPHTHNKIQLYDGTTWKMYAFSEISIAVPATTVTMYDIWAYDSGGAVTLEVLAWTDDETRATALTRQDGVYVKSGATTRRYLGSFRTTGASGQTEDSKANRFLYNYYNKVIRWGYREDFTGHGYTTGTYRPWNNDTANRVSFVQGLYENDIAINAGFQLYGNAGSDINVGIGADSTVAATLRAENKSGTSMYIWVAGVNGRLEGYHFYQAIEYGGAGGTFNELRIHAQYWM